MRCTKTGFLTPVTLPFTQSVVATTKTSIIYDKPTPKLAPRTRRTAVTAASLPSATPTTRHPVPSAFDWRNQWYPVMWTDDLTTAPHAFTLYGKPLVLFRDALTDTFVVLDDVCPHRAAPLSTGRLTETDAGTQIQCGYHGWTFDSKGRCTDIPYANNVSRKACMSKTYPTATWNGLVFVWFGDKPADDNLLPVPKTFRAINIIWFRNTRRTLPVPFTLSVENVIDIAHVNWLHHKTGQGHLRLHIARDAGIVTSWTDDGHLLGSVADGNGKPGYSLHLIYQPPCSVFYEAPLRSLYCIWHLPMTHDTCEFFVLAGLIYPSLITSLAIRMLPRWRQCALTNLILDAGSVIMRGQMVELRKRSNDGSATSWKKVYLLENGTWDTPIRQFREFLDINAVGIPWEDAMNSTVSRLSLREINDRLKFHTRDCVSCSGALKWANRGLWIAGVMMLLGAVLLVCTMLVPGIGISGIVRDTGIVMKSGIALCIFSLVLGAMMIKLRRSLVYTTKAYELGH